MFNKLFFLLLLIFLNKKNHPLGGFKVKVMIDVRPQQTLFAYSLLWYRCHCHHHRKTEC